MRQTPSLLARTLPSVFAFAAGSILVQSTQAANYTVTNMDNSGPGSLRQAITDANATAEADTIVFDAARFGSSKQTITDSESLPSVLYPLSIVGPATPGAGLTLYFTGQAKYLFNVQNSFSVSNLTFQGGFNGFIYQASGTTPVTIERCTVQGGLYALHSTSAGSASALNSTFVGVTGTAFYKSGAGTLSLDSCTITGNASAMLGGAPTRVLNSLVAGNTNNDLPVTSGDHNILTGTAAQVGLQVDGNGNPVLADNGGITSTVALVGGAAVDAGMTSLAIDQRGMSRPQGKAADIGAFEFQRTNTAPTLGRVDVLPGYHTTNTTLTASVVASDADGDPLTLTYQWYKNGQPLKGETGQTLDLSKAGNGDAGDTLTVEVTLSDGTTSVSGMSGMVGVENSAPTLSGVSVTPSAPTTNGMLTANLVGQSDADGDALPPSYQWFKNGKALKGETGQTLDLSNVGCGDKGETLTVQARLSDGLDDSNIVTSDAVTVGNSAPEIDPIALAPDSPTTNDVVVVEGGLVNDADGDALTVTYQWQKNGSDLAGETGPTLDLSKAGNGDRGDTISLIMRVGDGTTTVATVAPPVTIQNSAPVLASVTLQPTSPKSGDPLTATVSASDADSDSLTYTYTWTRLRAGKTQVIRTIATTTSTSDTLMTMGGVTMAGDQITVSVLVSDGSNGPEAKNASVTIGNSSVKVTGITLRPTTPLSADVLTGDVQVSGGNGAVPTLTFVWSKTSKGQTQIMVTTCTKTTQDKYDLSKPNFGNKGDTITLTVVASDGASLSALSKSTVVGNTVPVVTALTLSSNTPTTKSLLRSYPVTSDIDVTECVDTLTYLYKWSIAGRSLPGESGSSLNLAKYSFVKAGDVVSLEVRVSDGNALSPPKTVSVTIAGTTNPKPQNSAGNA